VVLRGVNDDELEDFAQLTYEHPWHIRFIELMPVGELREETFDRVVPSDEILERLARMGRLTPGGGPAKGNGPAAYYKLAGARGSIGVITPMTHTYCGSCNRVRLTADGRLRTCLFGDHEIDLRTPLRAGEPLGSYFRRALAEKPKEHALLQMKIGGLRALSQVGG
jgi:cyclic pyranopterin phosphate synthase